MVWRGGRTFFRKSSPRPPNFLTLPFDAGPKLAADADVPPSAPVLVERRGDKPGPPVTSISGDAEAKAASSTEKRTRLGLGFFEAMAAPC